MIAIAACAAGCGDNHDSLPSATVIAAGGSDDPAQIEAIVQTVRGQTVVVHRVANGRAATTWENGVWTRRQIYEGENTPTASLALSQADGRAALLVTAVFLNEIPHPLIRYFTQQASGEFTYEGSLFSGSTGESHAVGRSRYTSSDDVLAAVGSGLGGINLESYEHVDGGWILQVVSAAPHDPIANYPAGVGRLSDGSAIVASMGIDGLWLHRRDSTWSPYKALADGAITYANVEFPPESAGTRAVAVYSDPVTQHPRGLFASVVDGGPSGEVELVPDAIAALDAQIVFAPDGEHGEILLWDGDRRIAYLATFADGSIQPAAPLRPDLVFDAIPRLVDHPAGLLVLHVSRPPSDPVGEAALLVPLADFVRE